MLSWRLPPLDTPKNVLMWANLSSDLAENRDPEESKPHLPEAAGAETFLKDEWQ